MNYNFSSKNIDAWIKLRRVDNYDLSLSINNVMLSNDVFLIRYFFRHLIHQFKIQDSHIAGVVREFDSFFGNYELGNAFCYFGLLPQIVEAKTNVITSGGVKFTGENEQDNDNLYKLSKDINLNKIWAKGVYIESGLGDVLYRLYVIDNELSIKVLSPFEFNVNYIQDKIKSYAIKYRSQKDTDELDISNPVAMELHELHYCNAKGYNCIDYLVFENDRYKEITHENYRTVREYFPDFEYEGEIVFPWKGIKTVVYKQNANSNSIAFDSQRGVADIHGMHVIEDALSETISDCIDAIRKAGVKEYIDSSILGQNPDGTVQQHNPFNKRFVYTKGSVTPTNAPLLHQITQGNIDWESYTEIIQLLITTALNKVGLSPSSIGMTGLESINSSALSQENREKTTLRTRERALQSWELTLKKLLENYLSVLDYVKGRPIGDYSERVSIGFSDMSTPSPRDLIEILSAQINAGLKSRKDAIKEINSEFNDSAANEAMREIDKERQQAMQQDMQMQMQMQPQEGVIK